MSEDLIQLVIKDDDGRKSIVPVALGAVTVGRADSNTVRLDERNVSRKHARLFKKGDDVFAEDLKSRNGLFLNGCRIVKTEPIYLGDLIQIGDFELELTGNGLKTRESDDTRQTVLSQSNGTATDPEFKLPENFGHKEASAKSEVTLDHNPFEVPAHERTAIIRMSEISGGETKTPDTGQFGSMPPFLVCVSSHFPDLKVELKEAEIVLGRTDENAIVLPHRSVSRHHAKLVLRGTSYWVVDMGSANGVLVNGEEYAETELQFGDVIELGHVQLELMAPGSSPGKDKVSTSDRHRNWLPLDDTPATGQSRLLKRNGLYLGLGLVVCLGLSAIILVGGGDEEQVSQVKKSKAGDGVAETGGPEAALIARADTAIKNRAWFQALTLLSAAKELGVSSEILSPRFEKAILEKTVKNRLDKAREFIGIGQLESASEQLVGISEKSVYAKDVWGLREEINAVLHETIRAEIDSSIAQGSLVLARELLPKFERLENDKNIIFEIKAKIAEAEKANEVSQKVKGIAGGSRRTKVPTTSSIQGTNEAEAPHKPKQVSQGRVTGRERNKQVVKESAATEVSVVAQEPTVAKKPAVAKEPAVAKKPTTGKAPEAYRTGYQLFQRGQFKEAIGHFRKCVRSEPNFGKCYKALGICYAKQGDYDSARRYYRLYLKVSPNAKDAAQVRKILGQ